MNTSDDCTSRLTRPYPETSNTSEPRPARHVDAVHPIAASVARLSCSWPGWWPVAGEKSLLGFLIRVCICMEGWTGKRKERGLGREAERASLYSLKSGPGIQVEFLLRTESNRGTSYTPLSGRSWEPNLVHHDTDQARPPTDLSRVTDKFAASVFKNQPHTADPNYFQHFKRLF